MALKTRRLAVLAALLLVPLVATLGAYRLLSATRATPAAAVADALALTRAAGSFHLAADVQQTGLPPAASVNIGAQGEHSVVRVEGDVVYAASHADPDLRLLFVTDPKAPRVELRVVDGQTYIGLADRWQRLDDPSITGAPGGDYLGYLAAVTNVATAEPVKTSAGTLARYTFDIDGPRYAELQRLRLERQLAGQLPQGVALGRSPRLAGMTGQGELWVDTEGRARRQIITLSLPADGGQPAATARISADFSRFGDHVPPIAAPVPGPAGDLTDAPPPTTVSDASTAAPPATITLDPQALTLGLGLGILVFVALFGVVLVRPRRYRRLYAAIVGVTILSMVGTPLLNVDILSRFRARTAEAASIDTALRKIGAAPATEHGPDALARQVTREVWGDPAAPQRPGAPTDTPTDLSDCRNLYTDPGIDPHADDDKDGLSNDTEWCVGTDFKQADTDGDSITDTLELGGYTDTSGKPWSLDPLQDDTNRDGIGDGGTCYVAKSTGQLTCPDTDADSTPDLWDTDIDGDGVLNRDDLSPYGIIDPSDPTKHVLPPYRPSLDIEVVGAMTSSVVYVDAQVQPKNQAHLRYNSTYLDWPDDSQGQIQDLDKSTQDVLLIPVLQITSPVQPRLAAQYGIASVTNTTQTGFTLLVPLQPVGAAGQVSTFGGRLAFTSAEVGQSLKLTDGRIQWMTQARLDGWKDCRDANGAQNSSNCTVDIEQSIVATYYEDLFRVTGLHVSASKDVQVAQFGTPKAPELPTSNVNDEARQVMNLMSGLTTSFLGYQNPDLPTIVQNFKDPNASAPFTPTWNLDPKDIVVNYATYSSRDEALATTGMTTTARLLNDNYSVCSATTTGAMTPTLTVAYQETSSNLDMASQLVNISNGDPSVTSAASIGFAFQLGNAAASMMRRVQLGQYTCSLDASTQQPRWQALSLDQVQAEMARRYPNTDQAQYRALAQLLFNSYYAGRARIMSINGQWMPNVGPAADPAAFQDFNRAAAGATTMPEYVRLAYQLDRLVTNLQNKGTLEAFRDWNNALGTQQFVFRVANLIGVPVFKFLLYTYRNYRATAGQVAEFMAGGATEADVAKFFGRGVRLQSSAQLAWSDIWAGWSTPELQRTTAVKLTLEGVQDVEQSEGVYNAQVVSEAKYWKSAGFFIGLALTALLILITWSMYGAAAGSLSGIARDTALAQAIAATILAVLQFLLDFIIGVVASTGIGAIIQLILFIILYIIVGAISGDWNPADAYNKLTEWLAKVVLFVDLFVNNPDVSTGTPSISVDNGLATSNGVIVNSQIAMTLATTTTLTANTNVEHSFKGGNTWFNGRQGNLGDVKNSWAFAEIAIDPVFNNGQAPAYARNYSVQNTTVTTGTNTIPGTNCDDDATVDTNAKKTCRNTMLLSFQAAQAGRNLVFPFLQQLEAKLAYQKCVGFGFYNCSADLNYSYGPKQDDDPTSFNQARQSIVFDVLPGTVDLLWTWPVTDPVSNTSYDRWNLDHDGDLLTADQETTYQTVAANWDTDGDGLSDGYEVGGTHTDPTKADTDGDGLLDRLETEVSTDPLNADSDGDGLPDGQEMCHLQANGTLAGGWDARLDSGVTYHVCSDPNKADGDGDGLTDSQEKTAATSPWAPNTAPNFSFGVKPTVVHNGTPYTVLKPGDALEVDLNIRNTTAAPIDQTMAVGYNATDLSTLTVGPQTGSTGYTPPTASPGAGSLSWNFGQNPLLTAEAMTSTLQGGAQAGLTSSTRTTLQATVPYSDVVIKAQKVITAAQQVLIDADTPSSKISAPTAGQPINGKTFIISGTATDPTSWPVKMELRIGGTGYVNGQGQPYDSGWQTAGGVENWTYNWVLTADGVYSIETRATDYVGHFETPAAATSVIVDNTAPTAVFSNVHDGLALTNISYDSVTLTGSASDLVSGAPQVAGVAVVQLSIDRRPWRNVAEFSSSPPKSATWKHTWKFDASMYGSHTLAVRAVDALGQIGPASQVTVLVDNLPPTDIWSNAADQVQTGAPFTFEGHADDTGNIPLPSRPQPLEGGVTSASIDPIQKATVWLMPNGPTEDITKTVTWLGDVNGDGRADFAVGTPSSTVNNNANAGRVSILYGKAGGWAVRPDAQALADAPSSFIGARQAQQIGQYVVPAGDVNSDGLSDFLIGDPVNNQVYLIFGRVGAMGAIDPTGLATTTDKSRGKVFTVDNGFVGHWMAAAGDVNGDGFDDILIGATGSKSAVYLVLGSDPVRGPLSQAQRQSLDNLVGTRPILGGVFATDAAGAPAVGVGDLNNDQYADFVIADPNNSAGGSAASVYVFLGGQSYAAKKVSTPSSLTATANGSLSAGAGVGQQVVPLGDVNGDDLPDFAYSDGNAPHIAYGRASGWRLGLTPDVTFSGYIPVPNGLIAGVGDVDADGKNDLLLGTLSGRAYLVLGRADLATNQPIQAQLSNVGAAASAPFAAGADVNCDVSSDLLIVPFGSQAIAKTAEAQETKRAMRRELDLGPSAAPAPLSRLPNVERGAWSQENDAARGGVSQSPSFKALAPSATPITRFVDDDYCATCSNDGHSWGTNAFATIQAALDAAASGDTILVGPGSYASAVVHGGKDYVTIQGVNPDAVFIDAAGGIGLLVFPPGDQTPTVAGILGVTIQGLTIRNAHTGIQVNFGGTPGATDLNKQIITVRQVVFNLNQAGSIGVDSRTSNVDINQNTFVTNASSVVAVTHRSAVTQGIFIRNNLFAALPNAAPLPQVWQDSGLSTVADINRNGYASANGAAGDWLSPPPGTDSTMMTLVQAAFYNAPQGVYRLLANSAARGKASLGADLGYYQYRGTVHVNPTYCEKCPNNGHTWNVDAFADIQSAINSGAQKVLVEPGLYRQTVYLVNGVRIFGSGAALTVIAPPQTASSAVVGAEGVRAASLALVSLTGDDRVDGVHIDAGGSISVTRAIVRNTRTAISVDGAGGASALLVNNTLVSNDNGVAATNNGNVDVRNTIFAFHTGTALSYQSTATTMLHTFNGFWRNGQDLRIDDNAVDQPGPGEVFADPRFIDPSQQDYRLQADSPLVDAGDPSDPSPPGAGLRVDIGYAQSAQAAVYVSQRYCAQCLNDGLEWQVDAFDKIQDGINRVPPIPGVWTVGVDANADPTQPYQENLALRSGIRLVGSGADQTIIDAGGSGAALTLNGVTNVEVTGFTVQNAGSGSGAGGLVVSGSSNTITATHNIFQVNGGTAASFGSASTGVFAFNTVANNTGTGLILDGLGTWLHARFNIFATNGAGMAVSNSAQAFESYNLFYQNGTSDTSGFTPNPTDLIGQDPQFYNPDPNGPPDYSLQLTSPAVNRIPASEFQPAPLGGGEQADLGYKELLATPITLLFGKQGTTCAAGVAGVASVLVGVSKVTDPSQPPASTLPTSWITATLTSAGQPGSYWTLPFSGFQGDGLYRLYTRPADVTTNTITGAATFRASFIGDGAAPVTQLITPTTGLQSSAPVLQLQASVSDYVSVGGSSQWNVARVYFNVDGQVVTATRILGGAPGGPQVFRAAVVLADGPHSVHAVAVDRAGNIGQSNPTQVTVATTRNEAALLSPTPGTAVVSTTLTLAGAVHFAATDGQGQVEVLVDGVTQGHATLADSSAQATRWTAPVTLASEGTRTITLRASRTAGSSAPFDTVVTLVKDSIAPTLTVSPPTGVITDVLNLAGTAADATSGVATVEGSADGGRTWSPATFTQDTWVWLYTASLGMDYASFPTRVRVTDGAGNQTVQPVVFIADNLGPTPFEAQLQPNPGSHLTAPASVSLDWRPVTDGSGQVSVIAVVDQNSDTTPTTGTPVTGNSYTAQLTSAGTWYVHLTATDRVGNTTTRHFGPWLVGTSSGGTALGGALVNLRTLSTGRAADSGWQSSIHLDGFMDVAHGEWKLATERLDTDPRPTRTQGLWASFDATNLYIGWRGVAWGVNGTGYIYLDTKPGGTTTPWAGPAGAPSAAHGQTLPFDADFVLFLHSPTGAAYRWMGSAWEQHDFGAAQAGAEGDTEIAVPWSELGVTLPTVDVRMLAFNDSHGRIASIFPTNQSVLGPWTSAYHWTNVTPSTAPNAGQPRGSHITLSVENPRASATVLGPDSAAPWAINVTNVDRVPVTDLMLEITASNGATLQSIQGLPSQPPSSHWLIPLGDLPPGPRTPITVTAGLGSNVTGIGRVTVTAAVKSATPSGDIVLAQSSSSRVVDSRPPVVRINLPSDATLRSGQRTVAGTASDQSGIGYIEVRVDNGPWQVPPAEVGGIFTHLSWSLGIDVPASGAFVIQARGHDVFGQVSEPVSATVTVDNTPPQATVTVANGTTLNGKIDTLTGTAYDPAPFQGNGLIERVEVSIDNGPWHVVAGPYQPTSATPLPGSSKAWRFDWTLPADEGVEHTLRARATDPAGNVSEPSAPVTVVVDSMTPVSEIVYPRSGATVPETCQTLPAGQILVWGYATDGWGVAQAQVSVDGGQTWLDAQTGAAAAALLAGALCSDAAKADAVGGTGMLWAAAVTAPRGPLALRSRAIDHAANIEALKAPVRVQSVTTPGQNSYTLFLPYVARHSPGLGTR